MPELSLDPLGVMQPGTLTALVNLYLYDSKLNSNRNAIAKLCNAFFVLPKVELVFNAT